MSLDEVVDVAGTETADEAAGKAADGGGGDSGGSAVRRTTSVGGFYHLLALSVVLRDLLLLEA